MAAAAVISMAARVSQVPISVFIAASVRLYREGLATTLASRPQFRVDGMAGSHREALASIKNCRPDVVIVDVTLDDTLGLMCAIKAECSESYVLAIAVSEDVRTILSYAEAGADGFLTANSSISELLEAIERIVNGELLCSPRMAAQLLRQATEHNVQSAVRGSVRRLTVREAEVYSLMKLGLTNKQIAITLDIAEATVKNHVHHLLQKLAVSTRGQAIAGALYRHATSHAST